MNPTKYFSAIVDGKSTIEFSSPRTLELDALKAVQEDYPDWMEAELLNEKGGRNGFLVRGEKAQ